MPKHLRKHPKLDPDDLEFEKQFPDVPKENPTCVTGKICWIKKSRANSVAKEIRHSKKDPFVEAYRCFECGHWHVGHTIGTNRLKEDIKHQIGRK